MTPFEHQAYHNSMDSEFEEFSNCRSLIQNVFRSILGGGKHCRTHSQYQYYTYIFFCLSFFLFHFNALSLSLVCRFSSCLFLVLSFCHFLWTDFLSRAWLLFDLPHISEKFRQAIWFSPSSSSFQRMFHRCVYTAVIVVLHITNYGLRMNVYIYMKQKKKKTQQLHRGITWYTVNLHKMTLSEEKNQPATTQSNRFWNRKKRAKIFWMNKFLFIRMYRNRITTKR